MNISYKERTQVTKEIYDIVMMAIDNKEQLRLEAMKIEDRINAEFRDYWSRRHILDNYHNTGNNHMSHKQLQDQ